MRSHAAAKGYGGAWIALQWMLRGATNLAGATTRKRAFASRWLPIHEAPYPCVRRSAPFPVYAARCSLRTPHLIRPGRPAATASSTL